MGLLFEGGDLNLPKNQYGHNYIDKDITYLFGKEEIKGKYQICLRCKCKRYPSQHIYYTCDEIINNHGPRLVANMLLVKLLVNASN